jgi:diguanylate cyclase (GGDEF)-like protein
MKRLIVHPLRLFSRWLRRAPVSAGAFSAYGLTIVASCYGTVVGTGLLAPSILTAPVVGLAVILTATLAVRHYLTVVRAHDGLIHTGAAQYQLMLCDPLTRLKNRSAFNEELDRLSVEGSTIIVLFFDLDRFKDVNDTMGHKAGDLLLREVAQRAEAVLTDATLIARLGGDEFAAIIPYSTTRPPEDYGMAIVEAISQPFFLDGKFIDVGASVGLAVGDPAIDGGHELLRRADVAMYEAKGAERGGCRIFDDVLDGRQILESSIRVELGRSIIENELALHYQPIIDARTGLISSAESLLRWRSSQIGDVSPATIIPVAEESGQIMELTDWTLDTALHAIRKLGTTPVAVNISPVYFRHPDFVQRIFDKMLAIGVRPDLLTVELTEGVLISNFESARQTIARLREVGVKVFLDDFGTGYSSLSYLQHFELDGLKIDKSFLRNAGQKRKATQIIRAVVEFGHSLDMRVVCEGVESDWQARLLQLLGCDLLQGFEIGVPMPLDDLIAYCEAQTRYQSATAGEPEPRDRLKIA